MTIREIAFEGLLSPDQILRYSVSCTMPCIEYRARYEGAGRGTFEMVEIPSPFFIDGNFDHETALEKAIYHEQKFSAQDHQIEIREYSYSPNRLVENPS